MATEHYNLEAERELLGAIQLDDTALAIAEPLVRAEDFYHPAHATIFAAAQALGARGEPVHSISVANELKRQQKLSAVGGPTYLGETLSATSTTAHVESNAKIVARHAHVRRILGACRDILAKGQEPNVTPEDLASFADKRFADAGAGRNDHEVVPLSKAIDEVMERVLTATETGKRIVGLSTGLYDLDAKLSGMQPGQLIVIAARPSMGKSSLMMNVMESVAQNAGKLALVFSLEMSRTQLTERLLSGRSSVDLKRVRSLNWIQGDLDRLIVASQAAYGMPIHFHDSGSVTLQELRAISRRIQMRHELGVVSVDYLQLMHAGGRFDSREQEISEISRSLKLLAKELAVPVVALSQLNRDPEKRGDKRPQLSDLRESGAIEQDADVVAFVYREEVYDKDNPAVKDLAELIIAKQRNGPTGTIHLRWNGELTRFENLDPSSIPRRERRGPRRQAAVAAGYPTDTDGNDE